MENAIVNIDQGRLIGKIGTDYNGRKCYEFLGIPYAKPPIGNLRFKAPQPPEKWLGVRDATKDGSACYSRDFVLRSIVGTEDCLFLNVFTPEIDKDAALKPVMVWIHGGGFTAGSNGSDQYGPQFLLTQDIVLVAINYRLGVLGFLSLDDPSAGVPGNAGCKDMVMALKWVQANIKEFGGDPNNVTLFGNSAGGAAAHLLVLSPMAKGLFHKAIAQSGCALNPWTVAKSSAKELAKALNCSETSDSQILSYLQKLPVEKILEGQDKLRDHLTPNFIRPIGPVIEKPSPNELAFLSEDPINIILEGKYNRVPLIIGYSAEEGIFFDALEKHWGKAIETNLGRFVPHSFKLDTESDLFKSIVNKIQHFYFGGETPSSKNVDKLRQLQTDSCFLLGIHDSVKYHAISSLQPLYFYRFSIDAKLNYYKNKHNCDLPGTCHADELGYLFKSDVTPDFSPGSAEENYVKRMVKLWTNFAKTGNPNVVENVTWKTVSKNEMNYLDIGKQLISSVNPEPERIKFWDEISKLTSSL